MSAGYEGHAGRIGSYVIERKLGEGGMGVVYLARSRGGRAVALKVARAELAADPVFRERFRSEVAAARAVGGFHTAPVVDADPDAAEPWLATAYVPGRTLAEHIRVEPAMTVGELAALGAALAEALEAIHGCGLVHRDLKPGNIIMAGDGPRVLDFGIARAVESTRLTAPGHAFGTPGFLAPEQAMGGDVTGAADVFALGAVLVAAAGGSAFGEGTAMALMYRSVHAAPDVSAVPDGMRALVSACLAKDPGQRPATSLLLDSFAELAWRVPSGGSSPDGSAGPGNTRASAPPAPDVPPSPPPDGEACVLADADSSLVADADGILLVQNSRGRPLDLIEDDDDLDQVGEETELAWSEIADVTHAAVNRTRLAVTVSLHDGATHHCEINARRATRLNAWRADLAAALSLYLTAAR
ncbi:MULTISPECIES: serine/threonine-protein kinase [unclassified Streptomyces]|uniref:serine/threonine-protein kinase n=1 Tax=unclassified Streptomyces TaxID=2593676 RepID=UPI0004C6A6E9|nr:serine/threonine-protein kinase [Streptomyces sp. NRRL F-2747]